MDHRPSWKSGLGAFHVFLGCLHPQRSGGRRRCRIGLPDGLPWNLYNLSRLYSLPNLYTTFRFAPRPLQSQAPRARQDKSAIEELTIRLHFPHHEVYIQDKRRRRGEADFMVFGPPWKRNIAMYDSTLEQGNTDGTERKRLLCTTPSLIRLLKLPSYRLFY